MSLITNASLKELEKRPNLDLTTSIQLGKTLHMMCEVSNKSPSMFLACYPVLRMPILARKLVEEAVQKYMRPSKLAFGMVVTKLNVVSIFADKFDEVKPHGK